MEAHHANGLLVPIAAVAGVVGGDKNVKTDMSYRCAAVITRDQQSPFAEFCKSNNPSTPEAPAQITNPRPHCRLKNEELKKVVTLVVTLPLEYVKIGEEW